MGDVPSKLKQLREWARLSREDVRAVQRRRLGELLRHAARRVPYYREELREAGVTDGRKVHLDNFSEVPILTKRRLRDNYERLKSEDLSTRDWYRNSTGGSTGEPVRLVQDRETRGWRLALKALFIEWTGGRWGERRVRLWGSERDLEGGETLRGRLGQWVRNEKRLNAFRMSEADMHRYVKVINDFRPQHMLAYVDAAYELARFAERKGLRVHSPRAVMTSAGTLHDHMRLTIERVFRAPVFNRYGARETGDMACECTAHDGMHVAAPLCYVELLRPDGTPVPPGERGEVVVTLLTNYSMPLIRYRIGDAGVWAKQGCSQNRHSWPFLKRIAGRTTDTLVKADGGVVSPLYLIHTAGVTLNTEKIKKYRFVQEDYDVMRVKLVAAPELESETGEQKRQSLAEELEKLTEKIRLVMGEQCEVVPEFVEQLLPSSSGKYRYVVSKVERPQATAA
jgi:phenylacetate-CoA ligase